MNHLSTQIGALELSHVAVGFDDAAIELQASGPTSPTHVPQLHCIGDGALEASLANPPTMNNFPVRRCANDGALEAAANTEMGPSTARRLANTMCVA